MDRRNYKSDYDFVLRLIDCHGEPVGWPSCDFEAVFFTTSVARGLKIWSKGGETGNCYNDEGRIHVAAKNAMLPPGKVEFEITLYVPDERFEGGVRKVVERKETGIELVTGGELCTCTFVVSAPLPVVGVIDTVVKETEERHYAELKGDLAALEEKLRGEVEAADAETRRAAAEGDVAVRDWAAGRFDDLDSMLGQEVSDVRGEIESVNNSLYEETGQIRESLEVGLEKTLEKAEDAIYLAKEELEEKVAGAIESAKADNATLQSEVAGWSTSQIIRIEEVDNRLGIIAGVFDGQIKGLKARVDAIEEATEEEVLGALVEVPEGVTGTPVGYVMLKKTILGAEWKKMYEGGSRWHKDAEVSLEVLGNFEVAQYDRVVVRLDEPIVRLDGVEVWNFNCQVVGVTEGKVVLEGSYYYSSLQEPVMPDILAGTMFMLYRQ